jgi:hypothetical protein
VVLRNNQLDELGAQRILDRIAGIICGSYPDAKPALSTSTGRKILEDQYRKANGYGLTSELDTARYVITAWQLGTDFDTRFAAMREILTKPGLAPDRKAESIEQFTVTLLDTLGRGKRS